MAAAQWPASMRSISFIEYTAPSAPVLTIAGMSRVAIDGKRAMSVEWITCQSREVESSQGGKGSVREARDERLRRVRPRGRALAGGR